MQRLAGGLSSEIYRLDESRVVRFAPDGLAAFPDYDLEQQAVVQELVARDGIPAPAPARVVPQPTGRRGLVMPFVAGHIPSAVPSTDPWITAMSAPQQATLYTNFLDVLARIHHVDARGVLAPRDELERCRRYLDWSEAAPPALYAALAWCRETRPPDEADPGLLWGDVRLGNAVFDDEHRVVGVLDWEMATVGPAEHDVAWFLALESLQAEFLPTPVAGFPSRDATIAHYESRLGRSLRDLEWYETFALVRSTAILARLEHVAGRPFARNPVLRSLSRRLVNQQ